MTKRGKKLWPRVTSPVARRVLTYLFNLPGSYTDSDFIRNIVHIEDEHRLKGLCALWSRIQGSDIARQLAGGPALMPDIYDSMSGYKQRVYKLFRPRTLEQQLEACLINREWYLAPHSVKPVFHNPFRRAIGAWGVASSAVLYLFLQYGPQVYLMQHGSLRILLLTLTAVSAVYWLAELTINRCPDFSARATVLYHFLRREYGDVE